MIATCVLVAACGSGATTAEVDASASSDASVSPDSSALTTLTVVGGTGGGRYPAGAEVHVFADAPPHLRVALGWTGDGVTFLAEADEWHTTLRVPSSDVTITATLAPATSTPTLRSYTGGSTRTKRAYLFRPATAPRGLLVVLHGTGGSATFATGGEALAVVQRAVVDGWAVLSPEAEEAVAGDLDGDGKERWNVAVTTDNIDLVSLDGLIAAVRTDLALPSTAPNAVLGMSNGGAMALALGAVAALASSGDFAALRFVAAVSHCASGRTSQAQVTTTPTLFLGCANDDNGEVSLDQIAGNSGAITSRGVRSMFRLHPAAPLYPERFTRVPGIDTAVSAAIYAELAGKLDADGYVVVTSDALIAEITAQPALFPTLTSLTAAQQREVLNQLRATLAAHQMYSDWAAFALDFIDTP